MTLRYWKRQTRPAYFSMGLAADWRAGWAEVQIGRRKLSLFWR